METIFRYRSQEITTPQVEFIRQLIAEHPGATRRRLSLLPCEAWGWKQANGAPRDMVCRGLLLGLQKHGVYGRTSGGLVGMAVGTRHLGARDRFIGWFMDARSRCGASRHPIRTSRDCSPARDRAPGAFHAER